MTLDITVDDAVLMEHVDGRCDLFTVEPDDVLLQAQSGHLLQRALITVLHEDVHLLLQASAREVRSAPLCTTRSELTSHACFTRWSSTPKYRTRLGCLMPSNIFSSSAVSLIVL